MAQPTEIDRLIEEWTRAISIDPDNSVAHRNRGLKYAIRRDYALTLKAVRVSNAGEIEAEIAHLAQQSNVGLVVIPDIFTAVQAQSEIIIALTARHRIPAVYNDALFVRAGGLVSYGVDLSDLLRRAAGYVDRILKGAKPQDLPVQLPTKFELVINLKTAKALCLAVPQKLIYTAEEVID
jgi:putative tryptophan/tyrosine transport system substrate-binding protein